MEALHPDQHHGYQEDEEGDEGGSGITPRDQFLDFDDLGFLTIEGIDTNRRTILRVVGKFLPATIVENSRLKDYVIYKITKEVSQEPFCVVYFHAQARQKENCPGVFNLRWIYESLPQEIRSRMEAIYFVHPGLISRTIMGTLGRFLSDGLYGKVIYISRVEFLWDHIRKGQLEVPEFIFYHDDLLEDRPLMDYWFESDLFKSHNISSLDSNPPLRWMP